MGWLTAGCLLCRYEASPPWRDLMWYLTAFWALGTAIYFGAVAAITWTISFDISFGLILGFMFIWLVIWSVGSLLIVRWGLRRERAWWRLKAGEVKKVGMLEGFNSARDSEVTERA